jgi:dolichol-phosphate mannosyltransferase
MVKVNDSEKLPSVSIIAPTYREVDNLPDLIRELSKLKESHGIDMELLIMDDNSQDGTEELIHKMALPWVKLVIRKENRGLSPAVADGFKLAGKEAILVMDADLSHPIDKIPAMLQALKDGYEYVIGSRYVAGGSVDPDWGWKRRINSKGACLLAWPLTSINDPLSGFFAFKRDLLNRIAPLDPIGYKIGLELLVKSGSKNILEIPIHFTDRKKGYSKLTLKQQLLYLKHLYRLGIFRMVGRV